MRETRGDDMTDRRSFLGVVLGAIVPARFWLRRRDDTAFVQQCIDRGIPIPVGTYVLRGTVTFTNGHVDGVGSRYLGTPGVMPMFDATLPWTGRFENNHIIGGSAGFGFLPDA
jgi:hypothetical protein